jgi:hypothetical protein
MTHTLSNKAARNAAKKKLVHALSTSNMMMNLLPVWNAEFSAVTVELRKSGLAWLGDEDFGEIIYLAYLALPGRVDAKDGLLTLSLGESLIDELAENILNDLAEPKVYWFFFRLPQIHLVEDIELSRTVALVRNINVNQEGLFGPIYMPEGGSLLKVRGDGYVNNRRTQSAFMDAMIKVKWALQIATLRGFFSRVAPKSPPGLMSVRVNEQQELHQATWSCATRRHNDQDRVPLTVGLSKYLSELTLTHGEWNATQRGSFQVHAGKLLSAVEDPAAQSNVKSIRRSLEWAFDAGIDEDEHMRFIKTCIGLEAAIAEQSEEVGITEQLADRCAFLLNKTSTARMETRNSMRDIYKLRSKLVHGAASGLTSSERVLAREAEKILKAVLNTELEAVMEWYSTLER